MMGSGWSSSAAPAAAVPSAPPAVARWGKLEVTFRADDIKEAVCLGPFLVGGPKGNAGEHNLVYFGRVKPRDHEMEARSFPTDAQYFEVPLPFVSSIHFSIERRVSTTGGEDMYILTDYSRNGIIVDGVNLGDKDPADKTKAIHGPAALHNGSVVSILFKAASKICYKFTCAPDEVEPVLSDEQKEEEASVVTAANIIASTATKATNTVAVPIEEVAVPMEIATNGHDSKEKEKETAARESRERESNTLAAQLKEVDAVNKQLTAAIEAKDAELLDKDVQIHKAQEEIKKKSVALEEATLQITNLQSALATRTSEGETLQAALQETQLRHENVEKACEALKGQLAMREKHLQDTRDQLTTVGEARAVADKRANQADVVIERIKAANQVLRDEVAHHEQLRKGYEVALSGLREEIVKHSKETDEEELRVQQLAEQHARKRKVHAMSTLSSLDAALAPGLPFTAAEGGNTSTSSSSSSSSSSSGIPQAQGRERPLDESFELDSEARGKKQKRAAIDDKTQVMPDAPAREAMEEQGDEEEEEAEDHGRFDCTQVPSAYSNGSEDNAKGKAGASQSPLRSGTSPLRSPASRLAKSPAAASASCALAEALPSSQPGSSAQPGPPTPAVVAANTLAEADGEDVQLPAAVASSDACNDDAVVAVAGSDAAVDAGAAVDAAAAVDAGVDVDVDAVASAAEPQPGMGVEVEAAIEADEVQPEKGEEALTPVALSPSPRTRSQQPASQPQQDENVHNFPLVEVGITGAGTTSTSEKGDLKRKIMTTSNSQQAAGSSSSSAPRSNSKRANSQDNHADFEGLRDGVAPNGGGVFLFAKSPTSATIPINRGPPPSDTGEGWLGKVMSSGGSDRAGSFFSPEIAISGAGASEAQMQMEGQGEGDESSGNVSERGHVSDGHGQRQGNLSSVDSM